VVAPSSDMSGTSASIGGLHVDQHIDAQPVELPGAEGVPAFAVDAPPGLCVLASRLGGFGDPPDVVVSGINPGGNTGRAVLHSGTVGAALTAANFGGRGLAVSLDVAQRPRAEAMDGDGAGGGAGDRLRRDGSRRDGADGGGAGVRGDGLGVVGADGIHWATAAVVAAGAVGWLAAAERGTVLNINVPDLPLAEVRGARWGELARVGTVRSSVVEPATDGGRLQLELRPSVDDLPPGSDTAIVRAGYVAVTTITGIRATAPVDVAPIVGAVLGGLDGHDGQDGHDGLDGFDRLDGTRVSAETPAAPAGRAGPGGPGGRGTA
jgi:5'-nucleotidase